MTNNVLTSCRRLSSMLALLFLPLVASAQAGPARPWNQWGKVWASAFGQWSVASLTAVPAPGTYTLQLDSSNPSVIAGGPQIQPFATNAPLLIGSGASQETVSPTLVNCSWAPGTCTITVTLANAHPLPFPVRSGTGGLQEAINYQGTEGGTVAIDPSWTGTTAMITAAAGSAKVQIEDDRAGAAVWYGWNGSAYAPAMAINDPAPGVSAAAAISAPSINGVLNAAAYGAVSSTATTAGSINASSDILTLASAQDFANGEGILVAGAGAAVMLSAPGTPTVAVTGSTNAQSCTYAIAALDGALGETAASPATGSQNCGNAGGSTNNVISTYNTLSWTPVTGAKGYVVYENSGSGYAVAQIVSIPANVPWWISGTAFPLGQLIQPRGPQYNGWFYRVTTAGTSGSSQPVWCTTANCTVTDGSVTWTAQLFNWHDDGRNWAWFGIRPNIPTVPATPPVTAVNDALVTTIASGAGTTTLTLNTAATALVSGAYVGHDSTGAFNAAFAAQNNFCTSTQMVPGSGFFGTCPTVQIPSGTYLISGPLTIASAYGGVRGTEQSTIEQVNPAAAVLDYNDAYQETLDSLTVIGGKQQVLLNNGQQDNIKITLARIQLEWSNDYAVAAFNDSTTSDFHLSSSITIEGSKFLADEGEFYDYGDRANWNANWSETLPSQQSLMWGQGQIVIAELGGALNSHGSEFIPDAAAPRGSPGGVPQGEHWVEDWWQFYSSGDRFSGESGGGYPCVYYDGGFPAFAPNLGIDAGGSVSLTDDWLFCGGSSYGAGSGKVFLANGLPMTTVMKDNYGFAEPLFTIASGNNIDAGLLPTMKTIPVNPNPGYSTLGSINIQLSPNVGMIGCNATWNSLVLQFPSAGLWFPVALVPYIAAPECRLLGGNPTDGYWGINEKGFYQVRSGTVGVRGFVSIRNGLAAPAWTANTNYAVDSFVVASPDNLHVFTTAAACTSASSQPTWNTTSGGTTTDNTCTWTEEGQSAAFAPLGPAFDANGNATFAGNGSFPGTLAWGGGTAIASSGNVALNGVDINGSNEIVSTHLAAPLPTAQGGTGQNSTAMFPASGTVAVTSQMPGDGNVTTTSGSTDSVIISWPDGGSRTPGHCVLAATNSSAASNIATTYVSAKSSNSITLTHATTSGMTYDVVCTVN